MKYSERLYTPYYLKEIYIIFKNVAVLAISRVFVICFKVFFFVVTYVSTILFQLCMEHIFK